MIQRGLIDILTKRMFQGKAFILIGARQVGKTTMLKSLISNRKDILWLDADDLSVRGLLDSISVEQYKTMFENNKIVVIDEAQRIKNIGLKAKIITDNFPDIQLFITGSSSLDLANKVNEPLTGRKIEYKLFPFSFGEMAQHHGRLEETKHLPNRLIFGYYPDIVCHQQDARLLLNQLTDSYLYKDVLAWERIKKPDKLVKLLKALSYQVSSEVNLTELGQLVGMNKMTVEKYIQLLEDCQVIYRLSSFSRNLRNELKTSQKIYFYDNGIRNALINNFAPLEMRTDVGALWENFLMSERKKWLHYNDIFCSTYFWRTTQQQEIDYIEERDGKLTAFEFKWSSHKKSKFSKTFLNAYPDAEVVEVNRDNFYEFLERK